MSGFISLALFCVLGVVPAALPHTVRLVRSLGKTWPHLPLDHGLVPCSQRKDQLSSYCRSGQMPQAAGLRCSRSFVACDKCIRLLQDEMWLLIHCAPYLSFRANIVHGRFSGKLAQSPLPYMQTT